MDLLLLRHGIAAEASGFKKDSERPLTRVGFRKTRDVAEGLRKGGVRFDWILSSPFVRARETAQIVAEVFDASDRLAISAALSPSGSARELIRRLQALDQPAERLLLVGHEPYLGKLASHLLTGGRALEIHLKKAGACMLSIEKLRYGRCARFEWLLTPSQLREMGREVS